MFTTLIRNYSPATHADKPYLRKYFAVKHAVSPHPAQFWFSQLFDVGRSEIPGSVFSYKTRERPHL